MFDRVMTEINLLRHALVDALLACAPGSTAEREVRRALELLGDLQATILAEVEGDGAHAIDSGIRPTKRKSCA